MTKPISIPLVITKAAAGVFSLSIGKTQHAIMAKDKEQATIAALYWAKHEGLSFDYLKGSGVDRDTCTKFGVTCRTRAPGAGAKKKPGKLVPLSAKVRPDVLSGLRRRARSSYTSLGYQVAKAFDATQPSSSKTSL